MSAPLMPSPLDYIGRRSFGFYPPIRHAEPNAWILGAGAWSEVQVINAKTGSDVWVPRRYIGAVSDNHDALTVGLTEPLELRSGTIVTRSHCRVIEMPAPPEGRFNSDHAGPASVVGIRLESKQRKTFHSPSFRVGIAVLFLAGLIALVESASR